MIPKDDNTKTGKIINGKIVKYYYDNPNVNNILEFDFYTAGADGCFNEDPFKFVSIKIYFIQRDINGIKNIRNIVDDFDINLEKKYLEAYQIWCETPDSDPNKNNLYLTAQNLKEKLDASLYQTQVYYSETNIVFDQGSIDDPLWARNSNNSQSILNKVVDTGSNITNGHFKFWWNPDSSVREGDFYICFTWQPNNGTDLLSSYLHFYLSSDLSNEVSNPINIVPKNKYETLINKYTPQMYGLNYANNDFSVEIIDYMNKSIAQGFTVLENLALQIQDIMDANATQEPLLIYLANLFNIVLRSKDPTLWRRQIKTAIPKLKRKGTREALTQALLEADIRLLSFDQLWQTGSDFIYTDSFQYYGEKTFKLSKISLPVNVNYFSVEHRTREGTYSAESISSIAISTSDGKSVLIWQGKQLDLGDHIKVTYQIKPFKDTNESLIWYDFILTLPLADSRDDRYFDYPKKDWNTRLISEYDPMFSIVIPTKNPYYNDVNFGKIRTIFPYSENVYNMDEYNGSLRDSTNPCDIDKDFIEPCRGSISSYFDIDIEIKNTSNFRILECLDIINEYTPFHSMLKHLNFQSNLEDFVMPPEEILEIYVKFTGQEYMISGSAQTDFFRAMLNPVMRDKLANELSYANGTTTLYNQNICLFSPEINFTGLGISEVKNKTFLEILAPSVVTSGVYQVSNPQKSLLRIESPPFAQPISTSSFGFRLSNISLADTGWTLSQFNDYILEDETQNFINYGVETNWDVTNGYATSAWKIKFNLSGNIYQIENIQNGKIYLSYSATLPTSGLTNLSYSLLDSFNNVIFSSLKGNYSVNLIGLVTINPALGITDIRQYLGNNSYFWNDATSTQYKLLDLYHGSLTSFLISGWNGGTTLVSGKILNRLLDNKVGNLTYSGMKVKKEAIFPTFDDPNTVLIDSQNFKENYLLYANNEIYYFISDTVDSDGCYEIGGNLSDYKTFSAGGTSLTYQLKRYTKNNYNFSGVELYDISRSGQEILSYYSQIKSTSFAMTPELSLVSNQENPVLTEPSGPQENINQGETISVTITYSDGKTEEGKIYE